MLFAIGIGYAGVQHWRGTRAQQRANELRMANSSQTHPRKAAKQASRLRSIIEGDSGGFKFWGGPQK